MKFLQLALIAALCAATLPTAAAELWTEVYRERLAQAQQGSADAQFEIGAMHENGRGVSADRTEALNWYRKAADQGHPRAEKALLRMEENQRRFEKTEAQAESGDLEAQYSLGAMYLTGTGTGIDLKLAKQWLSRSAKAGHVKAQFKLGHLYYVGLGDDSDAKTAFEWFGRAAESNYAPAQYYLGDMYANGAGVARDYDLARSRYEQARDAGFTPALQALKQLEERISQKAAQQAAALALAQAQQEAQQAPAATAAPVPAAPVDPLKRLLTTQWHTGKRPAQFLPSTVSDCSPSSNSLICYSRELARRDMPQVHYKVKSIIRTTGATDRIRIVYREFVLQTELDGADADAQSSLDTGIQPGWQEPHNLDCKFAAADRLTCIIDNGIVAEFTGA